MPCRRNRGLLGTALLVAVSLGCLPPSRWQPPPRDTPERTSQAVAFAPEARQGVIYVYPRIHRLARGRMQVFIDGVECGYTTAETYVRIVVPAGVREVRTRGCFRGAWGRVWREAPPVRLGVEPGSIHYLQQSFDEKEESRPARSGRCLWLVERGPAPAQDRIRRLDLGLSTHPGSLTVTVGPVPQEPPVPGATRNAQGFWEAEADLGTARIALVQVPAGSFPMGAPELVLHGDWYNGYDAFTNDAERPVHAVTHSGPFWMGKFVVTQAQYQAVLGRNPSHFREAGSEAPVERVNWEDCREFLARLNVLQSGWTFRLPTEAEWEFACRGGSGPLPTQSPAPGAGRSTVPVGGSGPNGFGLFDLLGNVQQWTRNRWAPYGGAATEDPGPDGWAEVLGAWSRNGEFAGAQVALRGGCYDSPAWASTTTFRSMANPFLRSRRVGIRVVATPRKAS